MGMINITMFGSFPKREFSTCAEEGGHVQAIKRSIEFLAKQLGPAVVRDCELIADGTHPPKSPLGTDAG